MLLVLFTGATALVMEGSLVHEPGKFLLVMLGLFLTGGCANALNQYFEREIDARMARTAGRRALPQKRITPGKALVFSLSIGAAGVFVFAFYFNWLAALLSLATILFYSLVYTLLLKPNTSQNIVIGGAAGAMAPVGAWAAATGGTAVQPWLLFMIVFLWTPPHFWSLAMACKDDYIRADLPMLPVIKGETEALRQIFAYSLLLVAVTLALPFYGAGLVYVVSAGVLGVMFVRKTVELRRQHADTALRGYFGFSILYLFGLFLALIIDTLVGPIGW
jgi:protoheme IX farnesyltransferase